MINLDPISVKEIIVRKPKSFHKVYIGFPPPVNLDLEIKAAREFVNGKHLPVGTFNDMPMSGYINREGKGGKGISFKILTILSDKLNFTYDIVLPPANIHPGNKKQAESWLVEMLQNYKLDMAVAFIIITPNRQKLIKFSMETDIINSIVDSEKNAVPQDNTLHLLQSFHANVWYFFLLVAILFIACLILLTRLRSKLINDGEERFTLSSSLWFVYRVCTSQGVQRSPKSSVTRILLITWTLFIFLVSTYYAGVLSKGYVLASVAEQSYIKRELSKLAEYGILVDHRSAESCYEALTVDRSMKRPSGFAYPKNTTLNTLFDKEIKKLYYSGILEVYFLKHLNYKNKLCSTISNSRIQQLDLRDLSYGYYCWLIGVLASFVVFVMELLLHRVKNQRRVFVTQRNERRRNDNNSLTPFRGRSQIASHGSPSAPFQRRIVNGRRYLVARTKDGEPRLVPEDTLSALLFDLNSYEP